MKRRCLIILFALTLNFSSLFAQSYEALASDDTSGIYCINTSITLDSSYSSGNVAKTFLNFYIISEYDELVAAQVEVFDRELGSTYKQLTTDEGEFKMRFHPGFFDVKITHINYHDIYIKNIELKAGQFRFLKLITNALKD
jgi:hypothetical protein